jgi:general stress protein CsbA
MRNMVRLVWLVIALVLAFLGVSGRLETVPVEWVILGVIALAVSFGVAEMIERRKKR